MTLGQIKALRIMCLITMGLSLCGLFIDWRIGTSLLLGMILETLYDYFMSKDISLIISERITSKGLYFMSFMRNILILCAGLIISLVFDELFLWWLVLASLMLNKFFFMVCILK